MPKRVTPSGYLTQLRILVGNSGVVRSSPIQLLPKDNNPQRAGAVFCDPIEFKDNATLKFKETIKIANGKIERLNYAYKYERNGLLFMYERDPDNSVPIIHETNHLHVRGIYDINHNPLRFKTHTASFEEVFNFIVACFYPPQE